MDKLPLYELGTHDPIAWLDGGGRLSGYQKRLPEILFADIPIMMHITEGISIAPISDEMGATEDGHLSGPIQNCPRCASIGNLLSQAT
jgi:hypothetical protein